MVNCVDHSLTFSSRQTVSETACEMVLENQCSTVTQEECTMEEERVCATVNEQQCRAQPEQVRGEPSQIQETIRNKICDFFWSRSGQLSDI